MKKKGIIYLIIILVAIISLYIILNLSPEKKLNEDCVEDKNCVPSSCCHPESCVNIKNFENCSGTYCTQECSGPLDCNAGKCGCVKEKCQVIKNE